MKFFAHKVPGGKLIKIKLDEEDGRIKRVVITGDFFLHPEDCIHSIEKDLLNCRINSIDLLNRIESTMTEMSCQFIGATPNDIVYAILKAMES